MEMAHMARGFEVEGSAFDHVIGRYHERASVRFDVTTLMQVLPLGTGRDVKEHTDPR